MYDYEDYKTCICDASSNVHLIDMTPWKFKFWPDLKSQTKLEKMTDRPYLSDLKQIRVIKDSFTVYYKLSYDKKETFKNLDFLQYKIFKNGFPDVPCSKDYIGIPKAKKLDLVKNLCPLMPASRKFFWENLPETPNNLKAETFFSFELLCNGPFYSTIF